MQVGDMHQTSRETLSPFVPKVAQTLGTCLGPAAVESAIRIT